MGIEPDEPQPVAVLGGTGDGSDGDAVIPAQHEGKAPPHHRVGYGLGQGFTYRGDLLQVFQFEIHHLMRLGTGHMQIAHILHIETHLHQLFLQHRIADGTGTHIHPAPPRSQVHRHPDDGDRLLGHRISPHPIHSQVTRFCGFILPQTSQSPNIV